MKNINIFFIVQVLIFSCCFAVGGEKNRKVLAKVRTQVVNVFDIFPSNICLDVEYLIEANKLASFLNEQGYSQDKVKKILQPFFEKLVVGKTILQENLGDFLFDTILDFIADCKIKNRDRINTDYIRQQISNILLKEDPCLALLTISDAIYCSIYNSIRLKNCKQKKRQLLYLHVKKETERIIAVCEGDNFEDEDYDFENSYKEEQAP